MTQDICNVVPRLICFNTPLEPPVALHYQEMHIDSVCLPAWQAGWLAQRGATAASKRVGVSVGAYSFCNQ